MSDKIHSLLRFKPGQGGTAETDSSYIVNILQESDSARPYELLFMALGSCMYSTFEDVVSKMRQSFESVEISITGSKREEVPRFLQECRVVFIVKGAEKKERIERAFTLACTYCSIFQTLSKVTEMKPEIRFE